MRVGRDGVIGLIVTALSLGLLVQSLSLPQLPLTPIGPGFYPRIVLGLLALAGVVLFIQDVMANRAESSTDGEVQSPPGFWRVPLLFGIVAAYIFLLPILGYRLATILFVLALMPAIEWPTTIRAWATVIAISVATSLVSHLAFERYLLVLLPRGSLTGW
jgi:hypothetical protein|nr:MAG: hypothetical protein DIU57_13570 [Pseudomonadota bacterium]